jgi:iron complex outermembrane receptor protein/vitamin B12 transporter
MRIGVRRSRRLRAVILPAILLVSFSIPLHAITVHGTVTDPLGAVIPDAVVALVHDGKVVKTTKTRADGSYELVSPLSGRFYVLAGGHSFRQMSTKSFYGGQLDDVKQDVTLEPAYVRQQVIVTATGTPTPQAQVSAPVSAMDAAEFENRAGMADALRQMPGVTVVRSGERGAVTSLFIHGGNSDANRVTLDGVPIEDIGGQFDYSSLSTTGIAHAEVYRGPDSVLYGADAAAGVVAFTTPQGSTSFPSLLYRGDAGNFGTYRNEVQLGGMRNTMDYYAAFSDLQTQNSIAADEYHRITSVANLGINLSANTQIRAIVHQINRATDLPGTYVFFGQSNDGKESDQDTFFSGTIDHSFSSNWVANVEYGMVRKREQAIEYYPAGEFIHDYLGGNYYGHEVTIRGANGYTATGRAIMNYSTANYAVYPNQIDNVNNRDNLFAQSMYTFSPRLIFTGGFRFEDERGSDYSKAYFLNQKLERGNYDYNAQFRGEMGNRLFYSAGGTVEKNGLYGTVGAPSVGLAYYVVKPGAGTFRGTRVSFNFAKGYQEPTLAQQFGSLYDFLKKNGGQATIQQYGISPIGAELSRTYDGGVEQNLFGEHVLLRFDYFHNEFGNQIEGVPAQYIPQLLPNLSAAQQAQLEAFLNSEQAYELDLNSESFRAQGFDAEMNWGVNSNLYIRAGYTYTDAVIQKSYSPDATTPSFNPKYPGIPIGDYSPLVGARPFRRPPHTGFTTVMYTHGSWSSVLTAAYASRSDDSTFLGGSDPNGGNSLLLPNRNLDHGYVKIDLGGTYAINRRLEVYSQMDNLMSDQHIAPIGYTSLPFNFRTGLRIAIGREPKQ